MDIPMENCTTEMLSLEAPTTPELLPRKTTIDYIYYVEWRQFKVEHNKQSSIGDEEDMPPTAMQMTHSRALVGDFHHVIGELKIYHDKMTAKHGKPKKRVRFQTDEKLYTCIPDVLQGRDIDKIDKSVKRDKTRKSEKASKVFKHDILVADTSIKIDLDETEELLISSDGKRNSTFIRLVKRHLIKGKLRKMFSRKSRKVAPEGIGLNEAAKEMKTKKMERSNSYCRHDDADNVILIDGLEYEEIDEDVDVESDIEQIVTCNPST